MACNPYCHQVHTCTDERNSPWIHASSLTASGMAWAVANITETFAIEAYYQYDWEGLRLPAVGSFISTNDLIGTGGLNFATIGQGRYSDLGTDLDQAFDLPQGTLGFDTHC